MARFSVFLDTCVLVPITLADTLLHQAELGLFRPLWSDAILDELVRTIEIVHPDLPEGSARRRARAMDEAFDDASVAGWQPLVRAIDLPDPDDRHVLAAAMRGRADLIVTDNVKDYPASAVSHWGIEVQTADEFLLNQLDLNTEDVVLALRSQAQAMINPCRTVAELLDVLARCNVPRFVEAARRYL